MFNPIYHISPQLLDTIKRVTLLVYASNQRHVSAVVLTHLISEAQITSTYASTSIEGNPLPLTEVKRLLKQQPAQLRQSEREVVNYNDTLTWLNKQTAPPLTKALLIEIQLGVMQGLLPDHQIGAWRREPVAVYDPRSGGIVYLPPDHQDVERLIDELINFVQTQRTVLDPLILAGIFHKQLVVIHPFIDGNGRTTRLATNVLLAELGINFFPILSFENYYNQNVTRYFQRVGVFGNYYELFPTLDFTGWLEYFAEGILNELQRVQKQVIHYQAGPETRLERYHQLILDTIDQRGFINDRDYAQLTPRAKATRSLDFKKLIELGFIVRKGQGRSVYYQRS